MSNMVKGEVVNVSKKATKNPKFNLYSFKIDGDNKWYSTKFDVPSFKEGDFIQFSWVEEKRGEYTNFVVNNNEVSILEKPKKDNSSSSAGATGSSGTRETYWTNKEERDIIKDKKLQWQGSRSNAVDVVLFAITNGYLEVKGKKGEQLDLLLGYVEQVTNKFYNDQERIALAETLAELEEIEMGKNEEAATNRDD